MSPLSAFCVVVGGVAIGNILAALVIMFVFSPNTEDTDAED